MTTPSRTPDADPMRTWLTRLSLAASIAFTAHAEYDLARTLGADPFIAAMLPVFIDAYVVAAPRWFRALDIMLSLSLMSAAQVAAHALDAHVIAVSFELVVVVSLLVPVALWRTHALARGEETVTSPQPSCTPVLVVTLAVTGAVRLGRLREIRSDRQGDHFPARCHPLSSGHRGGHPHPC
jgi:hypothetical protein